MNRVDFHRRRDIKSRLFKCQRESSSASKKIDDDGSMGIGISNALFTNPEYIRGHTSGQTCAQKCANLSQPGTPTKKLRAQKRDSNAPASLKISTLKHHPFPAPGIGISNALFTNPEYIRGHPSGQTCAHPLKPRRFLEISNTISR